MITLNDVREANYKYDAGMGIQACKKAVGPANEIFGGDALQGLLYIAADGFAISVGTNLPLEERRAARLRWNEERARSSSVWIREKYDN